MELQYIKEHNETKIRSNEPKMASRLSQRPSPAAVRNLKALDGTPATSSLVKDAQTARTYLEKRCYCAKDQQIHVALLATIALQMSTTKLDAQEVQDSFRALSLLLDIQTENEMVQRIADAVLKKVEEGVKQVPAVEALEAAARECGGAAEKAKLAFEEFKEDCGDLSRKLSDAAEEVTRAIPAAIEEASATDRTPGYHDQGPQQPRSYANAVTSQPWVPTQGARPSRVKKLQILVDCAAGAQSNGLHELAEKEIIAKANMALVLIAEAGGDVPEGAEFMAVSKLQHGGVLFRMSGEKGAEWVRGEGKEKFLEKMGGTLVVKERTATVVMEYVPVTFEPEEEALRRIEQASQLQKNSIIKATYIKPKHRRATGQKVAFAMFTFRSSDEANLALQNGMIIEGKQVWGRRRRPEPKRCFKCQAIGVTHMASECHADHDTCARCGQNHRASNCTATDEATFKCTNCEALGHGPGSRDCPAFKAATIDLMQQKPTSRLPYFPTDDPETWVEQEWLPHIANPQDATWMNRDGTYGGGWSEVRGRNGKGTGRLVGGEVGAGGGKTYQVGASGPDRGYQRSGGGRGGRRWEGDGMRQTELTMTNLQLNGESNQTNAVNESNTNGNINA